MSITGIDSELFHHTGPQSIVGHHASNGMLNYPGGLGLHHFLEADAFKSAGIPGMVVINFQLGFIASHADFIGIDNDHKIARIQITAEYGFMLAHE